MKQKEEYNNNNKNGLRGSTSYNTHEYPIPKYIHNIAVLAMNSECNNSHNSNNNNGTAQEEVEDEEEEEEKKN